MAKKTKQDPSGQRVNRRKATRKIQRRLNNARRRILAAFREIPRTRHTKAPITNAATVVYDYELSAVEQQEFQQLITDIINEELELIGPTPADDWFFYGNIELPYRQGTLEEANEFNQLVAGAVLAGVLVKGMQPQEVSTETILASAGYRDNLAKRVGEAYAAMKSLSDRTANQVTQQITGGMDAGNKPSDIRNDVNERFTVAASGAKRTAETETNWSYNKARLDTVDVMQDQTGLRAGVIHISALLPTTRQAHADRHGNAYTAVDQQQWWSEGANLINCKCTTRSVLINSEGKVVQQELQTEIKAERSFFD